MMDGWDRKIQDYKKEVRKKCVSEKAEERTVRICQNLLIRENQRFRTSYFEFLYQQSKYIRKRWWVLQGIVLGYLWFWIKYYGQDQQETIRLIGVLATAFAVLIVPEIWKNRRNKAVEIEMVSYYDLRQVCAARTLLFAAVDLLIIMIFLAATCSTGQIPLYDLAVDFLLPVNVSCCICFRLLYSRWGGSEYLAVFMCLLWISVWVLVITNEQVYHRIAAPVWGCVTALTFAYLIFCIRKSLMFDERILEEYGNEAGI